MPLQDVFQLCLIEVRLLEQLLDARFVLGPAHAGGYGHNVSDSSLVAMTDEYQIHAFA